MKAIILAAGVGSRMNKYTATLPKGMIEINNKTLCIINVYIILLLF